MAKAIGMDMTNGSLLTKMIKFSIPLIFTYWLQLAFNFTDVMVLGALVNDMAVGAVGSTGALTNLIIGLFVGVSLGANILISKYLGEGNQEKVRRLIGLSIMVSLVFGLFLVVIGLLFSKTFLIWMGSPEELIDMSALYLKIIFLGMPIKLLYNFCASILRASGETLKPMIYLCIGGVLNVGLNIFSILVLGMTVEGVAIATVTSELVSAVLCLITLIKNQGAVKLCKKHIRFYKREFIEMLQQGIPSGIQSCLFSISNVVMQSSVNSFGAIAVSGNSYAAQLENFIYHAMYAFAVATMSFVSSNYGARKLDNVKKCTFYALVLAFTVGFILSMTVYAVREKLLGLFSDDALVISCASTRMKYICRLYFFCGIMDVLSHSLKGLGKSSLSMIISLSGVCVLRILWIKIMLRFYNDISVVYMVYVISWCLTAVAHLTALLVTFKKAKKKVDKAINQNTCDQEKAFS